MGLVILLIMVFIIIPILSLLLLVFLTRRLYNKGYKKLAILIPFLIIMFVGYEVYRSIYPNDKFYIEDFERYSGMKFPVSGKIIEKEATYPDLHGHYMSQALIQLSESDFLELKNELNLNRSAKLDTIRHPFYGKNFDSVYVIHGIKIMVLGFYKDGRTIFYQKGT
jgi:hypothetical protein